jgi:hypothetical protein
MDELEMTTQACERAEDPVAEPVATARRLAWETPRLEDVSEQVMAQPYIRFT